jgi:hypothetical protein
VQEPPFESDNDTHDGWAGAKAGADRSYSRPAAFQNIMSGLAPALVKLYIEAPPTDEEYAVITRETLSNAELNAGLSTAATRRALRESTLHSYRQRGFLVQAAPMPSFRFLIIDIIQRLVSFGIPSAAALEAIARHGPIIEVGAGTGYWAGLLQAMGVDIVAFDAEPTSTGSCDDGARANRFFVEASGFTTVRRGDAAALFEQGSAAAEALARRALLLVWPNNPDAQDNRHLLDPNPDAPDGATPPPCWDARYLASFIAAGGSKVIYVGEREATLRVVPGARPDCGVSSSRAFQALLADQFALVEVVECPRWWMEQPDLTVWCRA